MLNPYPRDVFFKESASGKLEILAPVICRRRLLLLYELLMT